MSEKINFKVGKINFKVVKINFNVDKINFNEKSIYMVYVGYVWCMLNIHGVC